MPGRLKQRAPRVELSLSVASPPDAAAISQLMRALAWRRPLVGRRLVVIPASASLIYQFSGVRREPHSRKCSHTHTLSLAESLGARPLAKPRRRLTTCSRTMQSGQCRAGAAALEHTNRPASAFGQPPADRASKPLTSDRGARPRRPHPLLGLIAEFEATHASRKRARDGFTFLLREANKRRWFLLDMRRGGPFFHSHCECERALRLLSSRRKWPRTSLVVC
jgi:hypothetical protein